MRLTNESPRCFSIDSPFFSRLLYPVADALEVAEVHPHQECAPLDVVVRHESPVTAVAALIAVVSHHEVLARGHRAAETVVIVFAILPMGELPDLRQIHRPPRRNGPHLGALVAGLLHETRPPAAISGPRGCEARA